MFLKKEKLSVAEVGVVVSAGVKPQSKKRSPLRKGLRGFATSRKKYGKQSEIFKR